VNYALFDDAGKFLAGRVMSESDSSIQVELESGKRVKVKSSHVLLRFEKPQPAELIAQGQALAREIDLDLAWEFASDGEFGFADLARDYFDASAGPVQQAAALFRLFEAPHYFRRMAKGVFRKAPEETVKAALLGIERKRLQALQIQEWAGELAAGRTPQPVRDQLYKILFRPDKNAAEYKAVVEASRQSQRSPLDLLKAAGAITSPYQFHWRRFLFEEFGKGTGFPPLTAPAITDELPRADVAAFSIDDSQTTEIDDALSVLGHRRLRRAHRGAGPGHPAGQPRRQGRARAPVHGLHAGLEAHDAARRHRREVHARRRPRLPGAEPVRHVRRGHAGGQVERDQARAGAHRRQPAP
jgi:exoribonuclease-2